ncbi:MAG TPA: phage/plasmid primase, P4 family, partial [Isosphaeraceae bacterium]|nr:phage/plasmid primase, P4 family [Isosphaeraceae bacterium]
NLHALAELAASFVPTPPRDVRGAVAPEDFPINRTDLGNARRLIKRHGATLRYCPPWGSWLVWDGRRWQEDVTGQVARLAKQTVRAIGAEAAEADDDGEAKALLQWALKSEAKRQIDALIGLAWSEPGVPVEPGQLNTDPMLLNVANGTLDLRTGALRPHRPEDLITKLAPVAYDPEAACPRWDAFLRRILDDDADLIRFVQRALGYALTGSVAEHVLFFLYGTGRNGKSTLLNVILALLGDYATTVDAGLLAAKRDQDHPTGLTDLDGRRFVPTAEVEDGKRLAEALVKKLTGGERIKARRMRADHYEFEPAHKIFLAANHKPEIKGTDEGIWSRIRLIEFRVFIPPEDRIKDFDKALIAEEGPGILAWLVRGCLDWQRVGLAEPPAVARATAGYRAEMDALGDFLEDRCDRPDDPALQARARALTSTLYHAYVEWSRDNGLEPLSARRFGSEMERRGFPLVKSNGKCWRAGLRVKQPDREGDIERTPF